MADGISITAGSGTTVNTDDIAGVHTQRVKVTWGADGTVTDASAAAPLPVTPGGSVAHDAVGTSVNPVLAGGYASAAAPTAVSADGDSVRLWLDRRGATMSNLVAAGALIGGDATNGLQVDATRVIPGTGATALGKAIDTAAGATDTGVAMLATRLDTLATLTPASGDYASPRLNARGAQWVEHDPADPALVAITKTVGTTTATYTRPADATPYTAGDCLSNSTSAPTAGGLTFTVASANGKGGFISGLSIISSAAPATPLQGELHLFDTAPTAINDNAAFTVSDAEMLTWVGMIPFALSTIGANSQGLVECNLPFTTVSATTLRGLVRVVNGYTPASAEVLTFRLKYTPVG